MKTDHTLTPEEKTIIEKTSKSFARRRDSTWILANVVLAFLTLANVAIWLSIVLFRQIDARAIGFAHHDNIDQTVPAYYLLFCRALHFTLFFILGWITVGLLRRAHRKRDRLLMKLWHASKQHEMKNTTTGPRDH
jgi:hypothetical protein